MPNINNYQGCIWYFFKLAPWFPRSPNFGLAIWKCGHTLLLPKTTTIQRSGILKFPSLTINFCHLWSTVLRMNIKANETHELTLKNSQDGGNIRKPLYNLYDTRPSENMWETDQGPNTAQGWRRWKMRTPFLNGVVLQQNLQTGIRISHRHAILDSGDSSCNAQQNE